MSNRQGLAKEADLQGDNLCLRPVTLHTRDNPAGPISAPHTTRFVVRSEELLNSKYDRSATGAERPILIPSYGLQAVGAKDTYYRRPDDQTMSLRQPS